MFFILWLAWEKTKNNPLKMNNISGTITKQQKTRKKFRQGEFAEG